MSLRSLLAAATALAALGPALAAAGETLDRVLSTGVLTGASFDGYPPIAFLNENNEFDGFDVDVLEAIAERLGVETAIVTPSWEAQVAGNWAGRWDIAVGSMTPTTARAEVLDFPGIYYYTPAVFVVHEDSAVTTVEGLSGLALGACAACSTEDYLNHDLVIDAIGVPAFDYAVEPGEIRTYDSDGLAYDDLRLGDGVRLDAVLTNLPTAREAIANGYPFRILEPAVFHEPLAVAVDQGDPEFTAEIARIIEELHADGTLSRLSEQWLGADMTRPE
ncbi:MAG: transporter substrate-binding domain-containing protein [Azospirillaceae bacterium]